VLDKRYRPIAYNLVCGFLGSLHSTPRGIERIDFGCASFLFENWPADCVGVLPLPWGVRFFPRDRILRARDRLAKTWREATDVEADAAYRRLRSRLHDPSLSTPEPTGHRDRFNISGYMRALRLLLIEGIDPGRSVDQLPRDSIYIDVGHNGVSRNFLLRWLKRRPDITPIFMVHDTIPLELPDIVHPASVETHGRIMQFTAQYARAVVAPTQSAGKLIREELARRGATEVPVNDIPLPIDAAFHPGVEADPAFLDHPYFLVCGVIEVRKNQAMLVRIWQNLVAKLGDRAPRLIIAGRAGFGAGEVIDQLAQSTMLDRHVFISSGLSTPAIAKLMAGARALLMPSMAEGFGLPPVEAMAVGTPAILSDIAAHRDAAGDYGVFIDPMDAEGWQQQIEAMCDDTPEYVALKARVAQFRPQDWRGFMGAVEQILLELP